MTENNKPKLRHTFISQQFERYMNMFFVIYDQVIVLAYSFNQIDVQILTDISSSRMLGEPS